MLRILWQSSNKCSTRIIGSRLASTAPAESAEVPANFFDDEDERETARQLIESKRNKSRLQPQHRRILNDTKPYDESTSWAHNTVKYQRMLFGKYGQASGVDPRICFPTATEKLIKEEYDRIAHPRSIQEMRQIITEQRQNEKEEIVRREEQIEKKLAKLDAWKKELTEKVAKREAEARAAKEKKERLVEEVRRHFGFTIDPRDDRFKEMLALKEKEDKKKTKELKKQAREEKIMAKLLSQEQRDKEAAAEGGAPGQETGEVAKN